MKKELKLEDVQKYADYFNEKYNSSHLPTKVKAVAIEYGSTFYIDLEPDGENDGKAFFYSREMIEFSSVIGFGSYVTVKDEKVIGRMFKVKK